MKKNNLRIINRGLSDVDKHKIELWYQSKGGTKYGPKVIESFLSRMNIELSYLRSIDPIDDITFFILDKNNEMSIISLVLNNDKESYLILTTKDKVKSISFSLIPKKYKDKIEILDHKEIINQHIYREKYKSLLYKMRDYIRDLKAQQTNLEKISLLNEIKGICIQLQDFSLLNEYYSEEEKYHRY